MMSITQPPVQSRPDYQKCMNNIRALRLAQMKFSVHIREMYLAIEEAIDDKVPLQMILQTINADLESNGNIGAFKSALQRIRKEQEAKRVLGLSPDFVAPTAPASHFPSRPRTREPSWAPPNQSQFEGQNFTSQYHTHSPLAFNNYQPGGRMSRL